MTKEQLEHLEQRLLKERQRAVKAVRQLEDTLTPLDDDGDLTNYPFHLADEGTDTIEQEQELSMLSSEARVLEDIDEALRRLYNEPDAFGRCEQCGRAIEPERLDLVPWTRLCAADQQAAEEGEGTSA